MGLLEAVEKTPKCHYNSMIGYKKPIFSPKSRFIKIMRLYKKNQLIENQLIEFR